jgi:hypothetical protein
MCGAYIRLKPRYADPSGMRAAMTANAESKVRNARPLPVVDG